MKIKIAKIKKDIGEDKLEISISENGYQWQGINHMTREEAFHLAMVILDHLMHNK